MLSLTHARTAGEALSLSSGGAFPSTAWRSPRPVVEDTRVLAEDVAYACRHNRRTTLINLANQQHVRVYCAGHVVEELLTQYPIWTSKARVPLESSAFLRRWWAEYAPLIRVVPDDGIEDRWLTAAERARVEALRLRDPDDVPSVKLALLTRGLFLSKDKVALGAAYGPESDLVEHGEWVSRLKAGGDAAELERLVAGTGAFLRLGSYGLMRGAQSLYELAGPVVVLVGLIAAYAGVQWLRDASRTEMRKTLSRVVEVAVEVAVQQREREGHFNAALPAVPTAHEIASLPCEARLARTCIRALARSPEGLMSVADLALRVNDADAGTERAVRAVLRGARCCVETEPDQWQLGFALTSHVRLIAPGAWSELP